MGLDFGVGLEHYMLALDYKAKELEYTQHTTKEIFKFLLQQHIKIKIKTYNGIGIGNGVCQQYNDWKSVRNCGEKAPHSTLYCSKCYPLEHIGELFFESTQRWYMRDGY